MSKRVPVELTKEEIEHIIRSLDEMPFKVNDCDVAMLEERLKEELDRFE